MEQPYIQDLSFKGQYKAYKYLRVRGAKLSGWN